MRAGLIAFTSRGMALAERAQAVLEQAGWQCSTRRGGRQGVPLAQWTAQAFFQCQALVFVGAAGIAVRAVAPHLRHKAQDPAVLCLDENGRFAIPLVSGHIGGANALALLLGRGLGAVPVITTATDGRGLFAVDTWAKGQGLAIGNPEKIKEVSGRLLEGLPVGLCSDLPLQGPWPQGVEPAPAESCHIRITAGRQAGQALHLIPPSLVLGVGCRKGTGQPALERAFQRLMEAYRLAPQAVCQAASIDLKGEEPGLLAFCRAHGWPFVTYSARQLAEVEGDFTPSDFVRQVTGVDNVCERAALAQGGVLLAPKQAGEGVTMALARRPVTLYFEGGTP